MTDRSDSTPSRRGDLLLEAVLDTAVEGIVVIDASGSIERTNPALERMFGFGRGELDGANVSVLMPAGDCEHHDRYLSEYLRTGEAHIIGAGREVQGQHRNGTVFPLHLSVSEVRSEGRLMFAGIIRDLSEQRRLEAQARLRLDELAHAARLLSLGEMVSSIAHEVNQPLTAIVAYAAAASRMLARSEPDLRVLSETLERISEQGERAARVVQGLRALSRKQTNRREPISLQALVEDVLRLLELELSRNRISVQCDLPPELGGIEADRIQIEQVLLNLVRNAIEALVHQEGERRIRISARQRQDEIEVRVTDNGPGLPQDSRGRLFETFYTTKPAGLGVGLKICRSILAAHGGRLEAIVTDPDPAPGNATAGAGACFAFSLPASGPSSDGDSTGLARPDALR